ncbi:MAG: MauE/DoxX family redox-associated membrane protein [Bacteroidota bacterium]
MALDVVRKISFYLLVGFYLFAGINHFLDPDFYYPLIPPYFKFPVFINTASGIIEVILGLALLLPKFRIYAVYAIIIMLMAFIPSHIYFIQIGSCIPDGLCVPEWIGWGRLLVIHPLLIYWVWTHRSQ